MGRKRKKPLQPGDHTTLYIPKTVSKGALEWINSGDYLSTELINLVEEKVGGDIQEDYILDIENILRRVIREELSCFSINKATIDRSQEKEQKRKKSILKNLKLK